MKTMAAGFTKIALGQSAVGAVLEASPLGGSVLRLWSPDGTAEVALQGAQLLGWQPKGHAPVIWLSPMERLANPSHAPKPVRGGTPVCWPWFAQHPTDPSKPAHGFIRTRIWAVDAVERAEQAVRVRLSIATTAADVALWPHAARVEFVLTLTDKLSLALTTTNTGAEGFDLTQALHTYFAVGDIADVSITGFEGQGYADKLDGPARKLQSGAITFSAELDRIYDEHSGGAEILDTGLKRRIAITKSGSRSSVVWNPWVAKASRMGDMGSQGWRRMVCVETSNAGGDVVHIAPGAAHTIAAAYAVSAL
jgi:D-hexose-6-phosphate mutarotase